MNAAELAIAERIKAGEEFYTGEGMFEAYRFKQSPVRSGEGYLTLNGRVFCNVRAIHDDRIEVFLKIFGKWWEPSIPFNDISFSNAEILSKLKPESPKHDI